MKRRLHRAGIVTAMVLAAVNIPLGATLLGLWAASIVADGEPITIAAVATFVVVAGATGLALVALLGRLGASHERVLGRPPAARRRATWLRASSGERPAGRDGARTLATLDVVLISVVVLTVIAFEIWFAFYSGSPLDGRSGR